MKITFLLRLIVLCASPASLVGQSSQQVATALSSLATAVAGRTSAMQSQIDALKAAQPAPGVPFVSRAVNTLYDANLSQSTPGSHDGMKAALASSLCAGSPISGVVPGCVVVAGTNYAYDAERDELSPFSHVGQRTIDYRGGGHYEVSFNAMSPADYRTPMPFGLSVYQTYGSAVTNAFQVNYSRSAPGYSRGNYGGSYEGWTSSHGFQLGQTCFGNGICAGQTIYLQCNGAADCNNYRYIWSQGGYRAASDETTSADSINTGELQGPAFSAAVATIAGDTITTSQQVALGSQGVGRVLANLSKPVVSLGCASSVSDFTDPQGEPLAASLVTLACGATLPASAIATVWGELDSRIDVPALQSTGPGTVVTTPAQASVHAFNGGHFKAGDNFCFAGNFRESGKVVSVAIGDGIGGDDLVTFAARQPHIVTSLVTNCPGGMMGLEWLANDYVDPSGHGPNDRGSGMGLRYLNEVIGAISPTQLIAVAFGGDGGSHSGPLKLLHVTTDSGQFITDCPLQRASGVVSFCATKTDYQEFQNATLSLRGTGDSTFESTPCTNSHLGLSTLTTAQGQPVRVMSCRQAGPDATITTIPYLSGSITVGTTGYGTTDLALYPITEVIDVNDYSSGVAKHPELGTLRLETPAGLNLALGDVVEEVHDYAAGYTGRKTSLSWYAPHANEFSGLFWDSMCCTANGSNYEGNIGNGTPATNYAGLGGQASPPNGYNTPGFPWSYANQMDQMPWPTGSSYSGIRYCPFAPSGIDPSTFACNDPFYWIDVFHAPGAGSDGQNPGGPHTLHLRWSPYYNTLSLIADHVDLPSAPIVTGTQPFFACGRLDAQGNKELVFKATACDQTP